MGLSAEQARYQQETCGATAVSLRCCCTSHRSPNGNRHHTDGDLDRRPRCPAIAGRARTQRRVERERCVG